VERAYRISKALEDYAKEIVNEKLPLLHTSLARWGRRVMVADLLTIALVAGGVAALLGMGVLPATPGVMMGLYGAAAVVVILLHFRYRKWFAALEVRRWRDKEEKIARAIAHNTRWYRPILRIWMGGWSKRAAERLEHVIDYSKAAIRRLNDQFVSPAGGDEEEKPA